jgi:peroxiredoxin Q/BCP
MTARIGEPAPDFELPGVDGETGDPATYRLADGLGRPQVLAFYPADDTPVCTEQLKSYTKGVGELGGIDARILAISPQSVESHRAFAAAHGGFAFPLLSDEDKAVGDAYGILGLLDLYRRSVFVIDAGGVVRYVHRAVGPGATFVPLDAIVGALDAAASPEPTS